MTLQCNEISVTVKVLKTAITTKHLPRETYPIIIAYAAKVSLMHMVNGNILKLATLQFIAIFISNGKGKCGANLYYTSIVIGGKTH